MTREEFQLGAASALRHVLTVGAGILAAHGLAGGDQLVSAGGSIALFIATVGWSWLEKSKLLSALCANLPVSELEALAKNLATFRANGANPLLVANIAQTAFAIANQELLGAYPELAPAPHPTGTAPPAPAAPALSPERPPQQEPVTAAGPGILQQQEPTP